MARVGTVHAEAQEMILDSKSEIPGGLMKTGFIFFAVLTSFSSALADGFTCEARHTGLKIRVQNHQDPRLGTRTPEVMSISDPLQPEHKTSVVFRDRNHTLSYQGQGNYLGRVDLRTTPTDLRTNYIAGTRLQDLSAILLDIEFSYNPDSLALANQVLEIPGKILYQRRNGEVLDEPVSCKRTLGPDAYRP